jgi:hypothetical protein
MNAERCTWCGTDVPDGDGYRLADPIGGCHAAFCRLEHVVPWILQGARWEPGSTLGNGDDGLGLGRCAHCGGHIGEDQLLLVRHRGSHRIGDALCSMDDLLAWAKAGGRWRAGPRT